MKNRVNVNDDGCPTESSDTLTLTCTGVGSQAAAKMKEAGDIGLAELMCTLDLYESHGMLWANTVLMVG